MDFALITGLVSSLKATYDLGHAAVGVRDANKLSETVAEMNAKLLDAQQRLFAISSEAMLLQQKLMETQQKNLELEAALQERGRYSLIETAQGHFALKSKVETTSTGDPVDAEPIHYVCQPCFHKGIKSVLQRSYFSGIPGGLKCPTCNNVVFD